jgi:hypothetical protein
MQSVKDIMLAEDAIFFSIALILMLFILIRYRYNVIKDKQVTKRRRMKEIQLRVSHLQLGDFMYDRHNAGTIVYEYPHTTPQHRKFIIKDLLGHEKCVKLHNDDFVIVSYNK